MQSTIPTISDTEITVDASRRWVGYAALQHSLGTELPLRGICAVASEHVRGSVRMENGIRVYDKRYQPEGNVAGHIFLLSSMKRLTCLFLKASSSSWEQKRSQRSLQLTRANSKPEDSGFFMNGSLTIGFRLKIFHPESATFRFLTLRIISQGRRGNHHDTKSQTTFLATVTSAL